MTPPDGDHAADKFKWEILVKCGDPSVAKVGASFSSETTKNGWFGMPDNVALDSEGRLWVATDGNSEKKTGRADGLWAVETEGAARGTSKHFYRVPRARKCAARNSRPTPRRCSSRSSIRARPKTIRRRRSATFENPDHPLAGLQGQHAAASIGRRDHQARWRQDRELRRAVTARDQRRGKGLRPQVASGFPASVDGLTSFGAQTTRLRPACLAE